jgi:eukaryotic-like serine/threonine-protein kinase
MVTELSTDQAHSNVLPRSFGRYTLLRKLATGGMAELYLALDRPVASVEKLVVIKRVLPVLEFEEAFLEMLLNEARIASTLSHRNIVQTYEFGRVEGTHFIAMEYIQGEDIRSIVRQIKKKGGEFPLAYALRVGISVCAGLAYAHDKHDLNGVPLEIVHRDISPQNMLITFQGHVKIVDFGIAKSRLKLSEQTRKGQLKGKIAYMAPEQAMGNAIDYRADIFSLGVILYELTTGHRLFKKDTDFETLKAVSTADYARPSVVRPGYPPALEAIVVRALSLEPERRYASAREMQVDLERFAKKHHLVVRDRAIAEWMQWLFREKIRDQTQMLFRLKQLVDRTFGAPDAGTQLGSALADAERYFSTAPPASRSLDSAPPAGVPEGGILPWVLGCSVALAALIVVPQKMQGEPQPKGRWYQPDERAQATWQPPPPPPVGRTPAPPSSASSVTVQFRSDAPHATFRIDGELAKESRVTGLVPGQEHVIVAAAPGYRSKAGVFRGQPGEVKLFNFVLDKVDESRAQPAASAPSPR